MSRKWFAQLAVAPCAFALAFGLSACSDDSSGTNAHIDTGDEISFNIPTGNSSSSKIDTLTVIKSDPVSSGDESSSSVASPASSATAASSASEESSSSAGSAEPASSENAFFNENWREDCLAKINEYRATEGMPALTLAVEEKQTCTDDQAAADLAENKAHGPLWRLWRMGAEQWPELYRKLAQDRDGCIGLLSRNDVERKEACRKRRG